MKNTALKPYHIIAIALAIALATSCKSSQTAQPETQTNIELNAAQASTPDQMLQNVLSVLQKCKPELEGTTYQYSKQNTLPVNWIIQSSPTDTSCQLIESISNTFYNQVTQKPSEKHYIDILQLGDDRPNDEFQLIMIDSIVSIAKRAQSEVIIRYLEGNAASKSNPQSKYYYFFTELLNKYGSNNPVSNVTIYAATFDYPWSDIVNGLTPGSWNHAKIIAVDGVTAIVGGQNYWNDYLAPTHIPPHDLSIQVNGAATVSAHQFANYLWQYVANPDTASTTHRTIRLGSPTVTQAIPPAFNTANYPTTPSGNIPILAVGNLGLWGAQETSTIMAEAAVAPRVYPKNTSQTNMNAKNILLSYPFWTFDFTESKAKQASITARHLLLNAVQTNGHIRISQQKIADTDITSATGYALWPGEFLQALVDAMANKNATIDILVSNDDGGAGGYGDDMGAKALQGVIIDLLATKLGDTAKAQALANQLLTIKQTPDNSFSSPTYNHAKVWIVDDAVFYVGSDNIYPGYLQEYGYIIGDTATCTNFITNYWNPIWSIGVTP